MIEAIIFDMDGLLIDSEPFWRRAQIAGFGTVGVSVTTEEMEQTMGMRIDEVVGHWFRNNPWEGATQKDVEARIVDEVIRLVNSEGIPRQGVIKTLDMFKKLKLPMVIASSSSSEIIKNVIDSLSIKDYFKFYYSAEHETHGKPHPGVFISSAAKLGVDPHACLVFEDSPSGVLAAKAAKMKCIAVPEQHFTNHQFVQTADAVLNSLEEFDETLLKTLNV